MFVLQKTVDNNFNDEDLFVGLKLLPTPVNSLVQWQPPGAKVSGLIPKLRMLRSVSVTFLIQGSNHRPYVVWAVVYNSCPLIIVQTIYSQTSLLRLARILHNQVVTDRVLAGKSVSVHSTNPDFQHL